ncbi:response regulator [Mucilaginibacter myungsuensis]|uniref:Response regulator n=1 Tax=Mucilaginibacter myungsuensis TaxID=649104 RepID=A0A929L1R3_9SPHI|nr:response regulator [Mucilaginibacter myungsuensis]MBE9661651.1 response regulator [Mucilaginibacter myungsuensis]MDN3597795.1 response regulator [Mucilaginibacter myungsuensis]
MKKILVLDDNQDILEMVTEVLSYEQFDVRGIGKAADLLTEAVDFKPELFLMDLRLADGNGGELCNKLKAHPTLGQIPVIIFTAYQNPGQDLRTIYGCDAVINKPFDLTELVQTVERLMVAN